MIDAPPSLCWFCGNAATPRPDRLCAACHRASRRKLIRCANCDRVDYHRGRGLCSRCYQRLARTGTLPAPRLTTPEEVLGD